MTSESKSKTESKSNKERMTYSARERARAVLSVWTERRRPAEVCKELSISAMVLSHWQKRALAGMLESLEPRTRPEQEWGPALGTKLEKMLSRKALENPAPVSRLEKRLAKLQEPKALSAAEPVQK